MPLRQAPGGYLKELIEKFNKAAISLSPDHPLGDHHHHQRKVQLRRCMKTRLSKRDENLPNPQPHKHGKCRNSDIYDKSDIQIYQLQPKTL